MTYSWWKGDQFLGRSKRAPSQRFGAPIPEPQSHFCCPVCGREWARTVAEYPHTLKVPHAFLHRKCPEHGGSGSMYIPLAQDPWAMPYLALCEEVKASKHPYYTLHV